MVTFTFDFSDNPLNDINDMLDDYGLKNNNCTDKKDELCKELLRLCFKCLSRVDNTKFGLLYPFYQNGMYTYFSDGKHLLRMKISKDKLRNLDNTIYYKYKVYTFCITYNNNIYIKSKL